MKAMLCRAYGPPESLELCELPDPVPGPGEVVVGVHAAAVNFPDMLFMSGGYQVKVPPPFAPGSEFAGEVVAVGPDVDLRVGDRVSGSVMVGAFAERVLVPATSLTRVPDGVDLAEAAAFGVTYRTAYYALRSVAGVGPGGSAKLGEAEVKPGPPHELGGSVVVLGAAGGVGLAAVDLAVALGTRVIAAASDPEKLAVCRQRGASATVDYDRENLRERIRELTDGAGARAVLDPVGGPYSEPALRGLGRGGVFVTLGYAAGSIPSIPLNLVLLKGITVRGMEIRTFAADFPDAVARDDAELNEMFAAGLVRPYLGARFPLEQAGAALRYLADRKAIGKVIIDVV